MAFKLIRSFKKGDEGPDILAAKRALKKAGCGVGIVTDPKARAAFDRGLAKFQKRSGLSVDRIFGQKTLDKLAPYVDDYGWELFSKAPKADPREEKFNKLISFMEKMARDTPGYVWGGGHGVLLKNLSTTTGMDCSSSCSRALYQEELYGEGEYAIVSGTFAQTYGQAGKGEFFTVWAHADHVFIQLHKGKYWRFDTSPHGDGGRGPRLRKLPRFTRGFTPRHWPGM